MCYNQVFLSRNKFIELVVSASCYFNTTHNLTNALSHRVLFNQLYVNVLPS